MKPIGGWSNFLWWLRPSKLKNMFRHISDTFDAGDKEREAWLEAMVASRKAYDNLAERLYLVEQKLHVMNNNDVVCDWPYDKDEEIKH